VRLKEKAKLYYLYRQDHRKAKETLEKAKETGLF
jgi:UPF0176 protein